MIGRPRLYDSLPNLPQIDLGYPKDLPTEQVDGKRFYVTPDGRKYPSVTTVLSSTKDMSGLHVWRSRVGEKEAAAIVANSSRRGTDLHSIAENYLLSNQSWFERESHKLHHEAISLWRQLYPLTRNIQAIYGLEVPLFSHKLEMAGRVDCIAQIDDQPVIVDFKNSRKPKHKEWIEDYFLQITSYAIMHFEMTGVVIRRGQIWIAVEGQPAPQVFDFRPAKYIDAVLERRRSYKALSGY